MIITQTLQNEHTLILEYLCVLRRFVMLRIPEGTPHPFLQYGPDFLEFIREFADNFHHEKEEAVLFKYLNQPGVLPHGNPIPSLLHEHEKARKYTRQMEEALKKQSLTQAIEKANLYSNLLINHIHKENQGLFPLAEERLSYEDEGRILQEFQEISGKLDVPGLWSSYEKNLVRLKNVLDSI